MILNLAQFDIGDVGLRQLGLDDHFLACGNDAQDLVALRRTPPTVVSSAFLTVPLNRRADIGILEGIAALRQDFTRGHQILLGLGILAWRSWRYLLRTLTICDWMSATPRCRRMTSAPADVTLSEQRHIHVELLLHERQLLAQGAELVLKGLAALLVEFGLVRDEFGQALDVCEIPACWSNSSALMRTMLDLSEATLPCASPTEA